MPRHAIYQGISWGSSVGRVISEYAGKPTQGSLLLKHIGPIWSTNSKQAEIVDYFHMSKHIYL